MKLYQLCDIYLDINEGNEILNAVEQAFDYELLILGYRQTAHHAKVTLSEHLFEHNDEITMESKEPINTNVRKFERSTTVSRCFISTKSTCTRNLA